MHTPLLTYDSDMANIHLPGEVEGVITPEEPVTKMIEVIQSKGIQHSGTFWTHEDKVRTHYARLGEIY